MLNNIPERKIKMILVEKDISYKNTLEKFFDKNPSLEIIGEAKDGKAAVELTKQLNPDMVIMDCNLPIISGIKAVKKIREFNPQIKIIILTAHSNEDEAMQALLAGTDAYVRKDTKIERLMMIIQTVNKGALWLDSVIGNKILTQVIDDCQSQD